MCRVIVCTEMPICIQHRMIGVRIMVRPIRWLSEGLRVCAWLHGILSGAIWPRAGLVVSLSHECLAIPRQWLFVYIICFWVSVESNTKSTPECTIPIFWGQNVRGVTIVDTIWLKKFGGGRIIALWWIVTSHYICGWFSAAVKFLSAAAVFGGWEV